MAASYKPSHNWTLNPNPLADMPAGNVFMLSFLHV